MLILAEYFTNGVQFVSVLQKVSGFV